MDRRKYVVDGLHLTVDESSYLVFVDECDEDRSAHEVEDLPRWIFESPFTIWLVVGEEPIRLRAFEGDRVRQQLLATLMSRTGQKAG